MKTTTPNKRRIAVIGAGAAGLTAAWLLQRKHQVTLYEKGSHFGGHAHTVTVQDGPDVGTPLDVGFMVLNDRTYPTLHRLLAQLPEVEICNSDMSFSYYSARDNIQYALNWTPAQPFAKRTNLSEARLQTDLMPMMPEIARFCRQATREIRTGQVTDVTLGNYLAQKGVSDRFIQHYLLPMGAAIWSTTPAQMLRFPARSFLRFFENHGLLSLADGPQWQYLKGGSQTYVQAMLKTFKGQTRLNVAIESITRLPDGIIIRDNQGEAHQFDDVVIATHADQALRLLAAPSTDECRLLGSWRYQRNQAVLHTDESVMPPDKAAWASWNYMASITYEAKKPAALSVTYHLNRLQGHTATANQFFLTLNGQTPIDPARILRQITFTHPTYDFAALKTQPTLAALNGVSRTYFCGSYFGYGFHEDAVKSGVAVAEAFGVTL